SDRVPERPEGDAPAVRQAAAAEDERGARDGRRELAREARLADAGLAEDGDQPASAVGGCLLERRGEETLLPLSADQRQVGPAFGRLLVGHRDEAVGGDWV